MMSMLRIAVLILLYILLTNGPHIQGDAPLPRIEIAMQTKPVVVPLETALHGFGPLRLHRIWRLESNSDRFEGISALAFEPNGRFTALNDRGEVFDFGIGQYEVKDYAQALPRPERERNLSRALWDSESMTRDPRTGRIWVGFERLQRICRYTARFERIERCASPAALRAWPSRASIEALVRFGDGRFLAISENALLDKGRNGQHDVLLWAGDPVEPGTPAPVHLAYEPPLGYRPTDALWLGGDRLLVLNRRLTVAEGFTAKLVMVRMPRLEAGAVLRGETISTFRSPGPVDNLEAMALEMDRGQPMLWIASDDNGLFLQQSLLFRFAMPTDWISAQPAP